MNPSFPNLLLFVFILSRVYHIEITVLFKNANCDIMAKSLIRELLEIIAVVAAAYIFYFGLGIALGTPTPMFSVVSESMEPTLHVGDMVIVAKSEYKTRDIVVYMRGSMPIIHRIIEEQEEGYIIKGDNNPSPDPGIVRKNQIVGKTIAAAPVIGVPRLMLFWLGI